MEKQEALLRPINGPSLSKRNPTTTVDTKLTEFELQNVLQAMNVLIPNELVISIFAKNGNKGKPLTISEVNDYLDKDIGYEDDLTVMSVVKWLLVDSHFWITFFWFVAGVCLVVPSVFEKSLPGTVATNFYLASSISYLIPGARFLIFFIIDEYKAQVQTEKLILEFRDAMLGNSAAYYASVQASFATGKKASIVRRNTQNAGEQSVFVQLLVYIEEVLYGGKANGVLTRRDLELLLLKELGSSFSARTLDDIMAVVDTDDQGTISPAELHHFLSGGKQIRMRDSTRNIENPSSFFSTVTRHYSVFRFTITSFLWQMSFCFFLSSCISVIFYIQNKHFDGEGLPVEIRRVYSPYLSLLGTISFTHMAYDWIAEWVDRQIKVKEVLASCVRYASYYHRDADIWIRFNKNNGLQKDDVNRLLEEAGIVLSEAELNGLFDAIDTNKNGLLCKKELEEYFDDDQGGRQRRIIEACLKSWNFWANFIWLVGSVFYLFPVYSDDVDFERWCYIIGGFCYWIGSISCIYMEYEDKLDHVTVLVRLNEAIDILMDKHDVSFLRPKMHRFKSDLFSEDESDIESQMTSNEDSSVTDDLQEFLSNLISMRTGDEMNDFTFKSASTFSTQILNDAVPILLYKFSAKSGAQEEDFSLLNNGAPGERSGILYLCPFVPDANNLEQISATLSSNGTKLHLNLPWYQKYIGHSGSSDISPDFMQDFHHLFANGAKALPNDIELPLEEDVERSIKSPSLIQSENGIGPALINFEFGRD